MVIEAHTTMGWLLVFMGFGALTLVAFIFYTLMSSNQKDNRDTTDSSGDKDIE